MCYARADGRLDVARFSHSCLMSPAYTTVCNKSKLAITEAHRISLQSETTNL